MSADAHTNGRLKTLEAEILRGSSNGKKFLVGRYYPGEDNGIAFHTGDDTPGISTLHEIGHWLDEKVIEYSGMSILDDNDELQRVIMKSKPVIQLKSWRNKKRRAAGKSEVHATLIMMLIRLMLTTIWNPGNYLPAPILNTWP